MLSFILSKMNMLLFATGIFVIALAFLFFIQGRDLTTAATNLLQQNVLTIGGQINQDALCSRKVVGIPDRLRYGINESALYEIDFQVVNIYAGSSSEPKKNELILSLYNNELGKTNPNRKVVASQSVTTDADIVLISDEVVRLNLSQIEPTVYDIGNMNLSGPKPLVLFPRAEIPVDSFYIVKEISDGNKTLYIIPCTSSILGNCAKVLSEVGCYKAMLGNYQDNQKIPSCFVNDYLSDDISSKNNTYLKCKALSMAPN
ncbi:MAG: hypothetical protein WC308_01960 [archaeon]|jgi:hypothetical protein